MCKRALVPVLILAIASGCASTGFRSAAEGYHTSTPGASCPPVAGHPEDAEVTLRDLVSPPGNAPLPADEALLHIKNSGWGDNHHILIGPCDPETGPLPDASLCVFGRQVHLRSGYAYATGTFEDPSHGGSASAGEVWQPEAGEGASEPSDTSVLPLWPMVITDMLRVAAEGTKFIVQVDSSGVHRIIRLASGGGAVYVWEPDGETYQTLGGPIDQMIVYDPLSGPGAAQPIDTALLPFINHVKARAAAHGL